MLKDIMATHEQTLSKSTSMGTPPRALPHQDAMETESGDEPLDDDGVASVQSTSSLVIARRSVRLRVSPSTSSSRKRLAEEEAVESHGEREPFALRCELAEVMEIMQARERWWIHGVRELESEVRERWTARDRLLEQAQSESDARDQELRKLLMNAERQNWRHEKVSRNQARALVDAEVSAQRQQQLMMKRSRAQCVLCP